MIAGLLHHDNYKHSDKVYKLLDGMAERDRDTHTLLIADYDTFGRWRNELVRINETYPIHAVVIFDEKVPPAKFYRDGKHPDHGISDNLYGNFTKQWKDQDGNGTFEVQEMPDEYTQDAGVCRLIPHSVAYNGIGWWKYYLNLWQNRITNIGASRSYEYMLDYWDWKLNRVTPNPLSSFIATADYTGVDIESQTGFGFDIEGLRQEQVFNKVWGIYHLKYSDPKENDGIDKMWYSPGKVGTAWHSAHSTNSRLGDFEYDEAYKYLEENRGPTLLLTYACSVGEWMMGRDPATGNRNIIANIFNSRYNNNIKCICGSGLVQWGGSFAKYVDYVGSYSKGDNLFTLMKKYEGKTFIRAHREWLERGYRHYINQQKNDPGNPVYKQFAMQWLSMNITGDGFINL
jgi:hypothetical protein